MEYDVDPKKLSIAQEGQTFDVDVLKYLSGNGTGEANQSTYQSNPVYQSGDNSRELPRTDRNYGERGGDYANQ